MLAPHRRCLAVGIDYPYIEEVLCVVTYATTCSSCADHRKRWPSRDSAEFRAAHPVRTRTSGATIQAAAAADLSFELPALR